MERRISMRLWAALTVSLFLLAPGLASAERGLVLVTGNSCPAGEISMLEVRKAYLGIGVDVQGIRIQALRMMRDDRIDEIFFQYVVAMSRRSYERRILSLTLKYGTPRPREFSTAAAMAEEIEGRPCSIGYMWRADARTLSNIKVIRLLWQGD